MIRMLSERTIQIEKGVYLWLIDYVKAFNKVRQNDLFELLREIDLFEKDISIILNIYWEQTVCIWVEK